MQSFPIRFSMYNHVHTMPVLKKRPAEETNRLRLSSTDLQYWATVERKSPSDEVGHFFDPLLLANVVPFHWGWKTFVDAYFSSGFVNALSFVDFRPAACSKYKALRR